MTATDVPQPRASAPPAGRIRWLGTGPEAAEMPMIMEGGAAAIIAVATYTPTRRDGAGGRPLAAGTEACDGSSAVRCRHRVPCHCRGRRL
jgi:hypothetical protein